MRRTAAALTTLSVTVAMAACSSGEETAPTPAQVEETPVIEEEAEPEPITYQTGETFQIGDWELTVGETDPDATEAVVESDVESCNCDLDPATVAPEDGNVYITAPVTATYIGNDYADPSISLNFAYVTTDGRTYETILNVNAPDDLSDIGDLYPDATGEGAIVQEVPEGQAEGGRWRISENDWESTSGEVYVAPAN